jgi:pantetheine-phosphate adenylyltransferase
MKLVFSGTFNPFTSGHKDLVDRTLVLVSEIHIVIGFNQDKFIDSNALDRRVDAIAKVFSGNLKVHVCKWSGLTVDYCKEIAADAILRGVRNTTDFEYEKAMAQNNKTLGGQETLFLPAAIEWQSLSSSLVRDLLQREKCPRDWLPSAIWELY